MPRQNKFRAVAPGGVQLGSFATAEDAARAYDTKVRANNGLVVNFPRPGTAELQAVRRQTAASVLRWARQASRNLNHANVRQNVADEYKGVRYAATKRIFTASVRSMRKVRLIGAFATAEEAARAYDAEMREQGRLVVNFPRPGTAEVQAVRGESDSYTLLLERHRSTLVEAPQAGASPAQATPRSGAAAVTERERASEALSAHAVPVWGGVKRRRTSRAAPDVPLVPAVKAMPATPAKPAAFAAPFGSTGDELSTFLRSISPPLAGVDAAVAAARAAGLTMQHMRCAAEKIKRPAFPYKATLDFLSAERQLRPAERRRPVRASARAAVAELKAAKDDSAWRCVCVRR